MIWFLYNILFIVGFILLIPKFVTRMWRRGGYRRHFLQRLGIYSESVRKRLDPGGFIWIHAVSVGEIYVALRFISEIRSRDRSAQFVLTTTTSTGYAVARDNVGSDDIILYFPVDFPPVIRRVLALIRPACLLLVECEFWPNLIRHARRSGIPVALINGRISDNSYRGYRKMKVFTKRLFPDMDLFCVQGEKDRDRLLDLGAPLDRVFTVGSAKYEVADRDPDGERSVRQALESIGVGDSHTVLLGGSTWPGEESILMDIYSRLKPSYPDLVLVLVPRHFERAGEVEAEIAARSLSCLRRSRINDSGSPVIPDVLLVDTTGELRHFYFFATIIFIGKSLTDSGGQNIIEPAIYAKPVIVGPNMHNFTVVMEDFISREAIFQVKDSDELEKTIKQLMENPDLRSAYGERAAALVREKSGSVRKTTDKLFEINGRGGEI